MRYINLSQNRNNLTKLKFRIFQSPAKLKAGLIVVSLLVVAFVVYYTAPALFNLTKKAAVGPTAAVSFLLGGPSLKSDDGRTNILILGTGGEGHAGADLSDTIILASVDFDKDDAALISIPRDLWSPQLKAKINYAYAAGKEATGFGLPKAKQSIAEIVGLPIHYGVKIDLEGFKKVVDTVGGIQVAVDQAFDDFKYPIAGYEEDLCGLTISEIEEDGVKKTVILDATGSAIVEEDPFTCRYEHLHFDAGLQKFDGATALKFVRSRQGTAGEGSDFARSHRQQKAILALKDRVFSLRTFADSGRIITLLATFGNSVETDIEPTEIGIFAKFLNSLDQFQIRSLVLTAEGEDPLLVNPPIEEYGGAWVLVPENGDWQLISKKVLEFIQAAGVARQS